MDKYEEFKKWFKEQEDYGLKNNFTGRVPSNEVFKRFEKEFEEKERKKEIRRIIINAFNNNCDVYTMTDEICTELEKEGYLK